MLRIPTKFGGDLFWGGNDSRGIAGPSRGLNRRGRVTGHFASGFDYFAGRQAVSTSNVIDQLIALFQSLQRQQMCPIRIRNVEENTNFLMPVCAATSISCNEFVKLLRKNLPGSFMLSPASMKAAKCMIASYFVVVSASASAWLSSSDAWMNCASSGTAAR